MRRRLLLVILVFVSYVTPFPVHSSFPQVPENALPPTIESPPPMSDTSPPPESGGEPRLPELVPREQADAVTTLGELRNAVRLSPDNAGDRLKLAQGFYRIGDLDAAIDECRTALKLESDNANAHLQLGVALMAKQDAHAASVALMEAVLLNPELTHAHYSLGGVQYSLGNFTAAIQSYRRALDLQPNFPDARYRLALVLKLTNQQREAMQLMEQAAIGGIPQAKYFMGNAHRNGQGVEKNLATAIRWWTDAVEFGQQRAAESLSQLRRQALSPDKSGQRRKHAVEAFRQYRDGLWADHPSVTRNDPDDSLGITLLKEGQTSEGVTALFAEALALSEAANDELARLYETGLDTKLIQFDPHILTCLITTAVDGFIPSRKALARIYGKGLGVTPDLRKAKAMLMGLPKQDVREIMGEIGGR